MADQAAEDKANALNKQLQEQFRNDPKAAQAEFDQMKIDAPGLFAEGGAFFGVEFDDFAGAIESGAGIGAGDIDKSTGKTTLAKGQRTTLNRQRTEFFKNQRLGEIQRGGGPSTRQQQAPTTRPSDNSLLGSFGKQNSILGNFNV